jgi:four helix bundle protein
MTDTMIKTWPHTMQAQEIARQLFRAVVSVGANIAEGRGRHEGKEYAHFLTIAQGSANEVNHWLNTALDCQIGAPDSIHEIIALNQETRKMLATAITSLRAQYSQQRLGEETSDYLTSSESPFPSPLAENKDQL